MSRKNRARALGALRLYLLVDSQRLSAVEQSKTRLRLLESWCLVLSHSACHTREKTFARLPAPGRRDTIGDHLVSVVRHSGPFDMKFEITAGNRLNFDFASVSLHFFYLFVGPSVGLLRLGYILEAHAP